MRPRCCAKRLSKQLHATLNRRLGQLSVSDTTHHLALIRTIADRLIVMTKGRIVEQGSVEKILTAPAPTTRASAF
jgi:peptide/nickel transport system ATP-binding protein